MSYKGTMTTEEDMLEQAKIESTKERSNAVNLMLKRIIEMLDSYSEIEVTKAILWICAFMGALILLLFLIFFMAGFLYSLAGGY